MTFAGSLMTERVYVFTWEPEGGGRPCGLYVLVTQGIVQPAALDLAARLR